MDRPTVSLCMIVRNEECCLRQCLESVVEVVQEIIIVDTGSEDETKNIAKEFTLKIYDLKWQGNFSQARNFSIDKACGQWILVMDADEVLKQGDGKKITSLLGKTSNENAFALAREEYHKDYRSGLVVSKNEKHHIPRLFRNIPAHRYHGLVCEYVAPHARSVGITLLHFRNSKTMRDKRETYYKLAEKDLQQDPRNVHTLEFFLGQALEHEDAGSIRNICSLIKKNHMKNTAALKKICVQINASLRNIENKELKKNLLSFCLNVMENISHKR